MLAPFDRSAGRACRCEILDAREAMKHARWVIAVGMLLFMGYVVWGTLTRAQVQCEVCLEFGNDLVCRRGAGPTLEEAQQAAQESACGGNAPGMTELIRCRNQTPASVQCTTE